MQAEQNGGMEAGAEQAAWLEWLCKNICRKARLLAEKPAWLAGKQVSTELVRHFAIPRNIERLPILAAAS
jgi:hypothetical protein